MIILIKFERNLKIRKTQQHNLKVFHGKYWNIFMSDCIFGIPLFGRMKKKKMWNQHRMKERYTICFEWISRSRNDCLWRVNFWTNVTRARPVFYEDPPRGIRELVQRVWNSFESNIDKHAGICAHCNAIDAVKRAIPVMLSSSGYMAIISLQFTTNTNISKYRKQWKINNSYS